jgi:hypothetical protein
MMASVPIWKSRGEAATKAFRRCRSEWAARALARCPTFGSVLQRRTEKLPAGAERRELIEARVPPKPADPIRYSPIRFGVAAGFGVRVDNGQPSDTDLRDPTPAEADSSLRIVPY